MRWVEIQTYVGLDRRETRKFRVIERRRADLSTRLPALATKLRQMRVQALGARSAEQRQAVARQAEAVASLAAYIGHLIVGQRLKALADRLIAAADPMASFDWVDQELDALAQRVAFEQVR